MSSTKHWPAAGQCRGVVRRPSQILALTILLSATLLDQPHTHRKISNLLGEKEIRARVVGKGHYR